MAAVCEQRPVRGGLAAWTEAGPSADAAQTAIVDREREVARLTSEIAVLEWFQEWREIYWRSRHSDLRARSRASRARRLEAERRAEALYEFAERLRRPAPLLLVAEVRSPS